MTLFRIGTKMVITQILDCFVVLCVRDFPISSQTGEKVNSVKEHTKNINDIQLSKDGSMFITASKDTSAKVRVGLKYSHIFGRHLSVGYVNKDETTGMIHMILKV